MINATQIRKGMVIIYDGDPYKVMDYRFSMKGRGSNSIPTKLRNIVTGAQAEVRYRSDDKIEKAFISEDEYEYLYSDGDGYYFMNTENYEQITLSKDEIEDVVGYLLPNSACKIQMYDNKAVGVSVASQVHLKIIETEPAIKGATASGNVTKPAKLETGITIQVPMFIQQYDTVIISTGTGEYTGRPGKQ